MKLTFLAGGSSIHTVRWVNEMARRGHQVDLATMHREEDPIDAEIHVYHLRFGPPWGYYLNAPELSRLLRVLQPDLLHTHYASGYGTLARLVRFHPNILSVWGSDVYAFPTQAKWKRMLIRKNLAAADALASTSHAMKAHAERLLPLRRPIAVTPFGVDLERFHPANSTNRDTVCIGCVKRLEEWFGIEYLLRAFRILLDRFGEEGAQGRRLRDRVELMIVGGGSLLHPLQQLSRDLAIDDRVRFVGRILHSEVPMWLNGMDIFCVPSITSESFGVVAVEAAACGLPIVASQVGGLPEIVRDGETGYLVPPRDPQALAERVHRLVADPALRLRMGAAGRRLVEREYDWKENADRMERLYHSVLSDYSRGRIL